MAAYFFAFFLVFCIGFVPAANAQQQALQRGMSFNDVMRIKGAPLEKDNHESSRMSIWRYSDAVLKFHDGKLVVQTAPGPAAGHAEPAYGRITRDHGKRPISQQEVDEIMDSIPEDTGEAASGPNPVPPPPVQGGVGAPQIIGDE